MIVVRYGANGWTGVWQVVCSGYLQSEGLFPLQLLAKASATLCPVGVIENVETPGLQGARL